MLPSSYNGTHLPHGQCSRYLASLSVECLTTMEGTRLKTPTHLGKHHPSTLNRAQTRPADPRDVLNRTGSQPQSHELTASIGGQCTGPPPVSVSLFRTHLIGRNIHAPGRRIAIELHTVRRKLPTKSETSQNLSATPRRWVDPDNKNST